MIQNIIIAFICLLLIYILIVRNNLVKLNNSVKEAFATMDVYLKKRWDLIPNIVETVSEYAEYEKDTLETLTNLRNTSYTEISNNDKFNLNEELSQNISKILMISENYPNLKANENFLDLSNKLTQVENDIANARKYYNAVIRNYNNKVQMFPSNLIALLFGYKEKQMFQATTEERENINMHL